MTLKKQQTEEKAKQKKKNGGARWPNGGGAQPGAGRPKFIPTDAERRQVEALSGYGLPQNQIAVLVRDGIHLDTLCKYFEKELVSGKAKANGAVGKTLYQKATGGDTAAMIWWSKTQMRWIEANRLELTGKDGAPLEAKLDLSALSTEQLLALKAAHEVLKKGSSGGGE